MSKSKLYFGRDYFIKINDDIEYLHKSPERFVKVERADSSEVTFVNLNSVIYIEDISNQERDYGDKN